MLEIFFRQALCLLILFPNCTNAGVQHTMKIFELLRLMTLRLKKFLNNKKSWYDKAISKGFDDNRVRAYINRKAKERGEKFYNIFLSKRLLFNKYDHVDFDEYDAQATVARPDNSVNIVKWVDFEYYGEKNEGRPCC